MGDVADKRVACHLPKLLSQNGDAAIASPSSMRAFEPTGWGLEGRAFLT
jgi:hypothetical protein